MTTDTTERGLERLICTALTGNPCEPAKGAISDPQAAYGGNGWICGSPFDYNREYCVDLIQLSAFLLETQPDATESLSLHEDSPTQRKFGEGKPRRYWDRLFKEVGAAVNGVNVVNWIAWAAVRLGGWAAWNGHRKRDPPAGALK